MRSIKVRYQDGFLTAGELASLIEAFSKNLAVPLTPTGDLEVETEVVEFSSPDGRYKVLIEVRGESWSSPNSKRKLINLLNEAIRQSVSTDKVWQFFCLLVPNKVTVGSS